MYYKLRQFWNKTKRAFCLIAWSYKNSPWNEYDVFISLISHQLNTMQKRFSKDDIYIGQKNDSNRMRLVIELLNRFINEYYSTKWWDENIESVSWEPYKTVYKNNLSEEENKANMFKSYKQDQKCKDLAFDIIKNNINRWWI